MLKPYDLKQDPTFFESACKIMIMLADEIKVDSLNRRRLEQNVKDLENRQYLERTETGTGFKLGEKFLNCFVDKYTATDEIYANYPVFMEQNGVSIPLLTMDRNVFAEIYIKKLNGSIKEHQEIVLDVKFGVKEDLLKLGVGKFLSSEYWRAIRPLRLKEIKEKNINIDPYEDSFI
jgi:hypothetical protein